MGGWKGSAAKRLVINFNFTFNSISKACVPSHALQLVFLQVKNVKITAIYTSLDTDLATLI